MRGFVAVTDPGWLRTLSLTGPSEVNFWQPRPTPVRQPIGTPWIFKVRGTDRIAGFGYFSYWTQMPLAIAWETFGPANGVSSYTEMLKRVRSLRHEDDSDDRIGCVVLAEVTLLSQGEWIAAPADWKPNIVRGAGYDLGFGEGQRIWAQLQTLTSFGSSISPIVSVPGGYATPTMTSARIGQGAFRFMVMDAYERRCAISGERTLPALEAAHIRPFSETKAHELRNGILMRSDLHRFYDLGLVTVDSAYTFRVSSTIERDYSNGKIYYALDGKTISTPQVDEAKPDREALAWHSSQVFRP
jgi:putative restriction endonuclease